MSAALSPSRAAVEHGIALAWSLALALILTWPMPLDPGGQALGFAMADGYKHLWTLWWMRASVHAEGALPFHTLLVNHPFGMELYPIEPLGGLVAVALPGVDLVLLSNLMVLGNLTLTGLAAAWLGRLVGGGRVGGLVSATLLEGSASAAFAVYVGVGELQHLWWLPLGMGTLLQARRTLRWRWFLALSACLAGAVLSSFYLGLLLALGVAVWALSTLGHPRGWPALLPRYALAAGLALAVVWPVTRAFATSYQLNPPPRGGVVAAVLAERGQPVVDTTTARLQPLDLVRVADPGKDSAQRAYGGGRSLGLLAVALGLVGLVRRPRQGLPWLAVGLVAVVLALGSYLTWGGEPVEVGGAALRLPFLYLNRLLAVVAEPLNFPVRFLGLASLALAVLAARAVRGWGLLLGPLAALEIALTQLVPRPWPTLPLPDVSALAPLAQQHPGEGVFDLTFMAWPDARARRVSLAAQLVHGHPVHSMPIERVEHFARDGVWAVQALPIYEALRAARGGEVLPVDPQDARGSLILLEHLGLPIVLVHDGGRGNPLPGPLVRLLTELCGPPLVEGGGHAAWRVPPQHPTPEELAHWKDRHLFAWEQIRHRAGRIGPRLD